MFTPSTLVNVVYAYFLQMALWKYKNFKIMILSTNLSLNYICNCSAPWACRRERSASTSVRLGHGYRGTGTRERIANGE